MKIRVSFAAVVWLLASASIASAQSGMIWGEAGSQNYEFGDGTPLKRPALGGGFQAVLGGDASKDSGFLLPIGAEMRTDTTFDALDLLGYADFAFRVKNVSFGPGWNFGMIYRPSVADFRCAGHVPQGSSCLVDGTRDIGNFVGMGLSGFAKVSFGPQGRAFLQGRYVSYLPDLVWFRSAAEAYASFTGDFESVSIPTDFPEFSSGRDIRMSVGYVFGGADSITKVLRVQYSERRFNFVEEGANLNGLFDQRGRQITVGAGIGF